MSWARADSAASIFEESWDAVARVAERENLAEASESRVGGSGKSTVLKDIGSRPAVC
jgi:hypothetical protein